MRYSNVFILLLSYLSSPLANAVTISASSSNTYTVSPVYYSIGYLDRSHQIVLSTSYSGSVTHQSGDFYVATDTAGQAHVARFPSESGAPVLSVSKNYYFFMPTLWSNTSTSAQTVSISLTKYNAVIFTKKFIVPATSVCSATINNLSIGNVASGSSASSINLPFSISGVSSNKSLVISGADIQADGKLNLGGSTSGVKVYPASKYISGSTWSAGSTSGSIPLTVDASAGEAGTWSSTLLATLTCP